MYKVLKKIIKKIEVIVLNFLCLILSLCIPRRKDIIIFGGWFGKRFADNSRYLFLHCLNNKEELGFKKVIWVTDSEEIYEELRANKIEVYYKKSLQSIWYHLRAKYHVIDQVIFDINPYLSVGAKRIQLWHGVGFKRIATLKEQPDITKISYKLKYLLKFISTPGFWYRYKFLSTSEFATKEIFWISFRLWENEYFESNYPRNIYAMSDNNFLDSKQNKLIQRLRYERESGKNIILYLPTYRNIAQIGSKNNRSYPLNIKDLEEFKEFNKFLEENNICFLSKFHLAGDANEGFDTENFYNIESEMDIYPILKEIDMLITDYSSVYADFLFLDRPIIFYCYDLENYLLEDKGVLFDYNDVTPGDKVYNLKELKQGIMKNLEQDIYHEFREDIKKLYFGDNINDNFESFVEKMFKEK